jgi:FKBP-type peptidyl-prolyl cis-trans isomerase SlyD
MRRAGQRFGKHRRGQQKCVTLQPAEAFGEIQTRLIREIPRTCFRTKSALAVGMRLNARSSDSSQARRVRIVELRRDTVVVDGNHPDAGRKVTFEIRLLAVASASEIEFDNGGEG